ncbi:MAG: hypothetical protein OQK05_03875 [Pseudopelagicola sp.]|nr:hypothetical protein [Pseudopelagicola sp.]
MPRHRLALFSPWFGPWPEWINLYFESCRWNPEVTWLVPTDQEPPPCQPPNVVFMPMSLAEFTARASDVTGLSLAPENAYKICDYMPLIGEMFADDLHGFTHFGYTDNDIIYGQLACELTPERLASYEIISSHANLQAGHLTVMQNTPRMTRVWRKTPFWRRQIADPKHRGFDERAFGRRLDPRKWHPPWRRYKVLWHEMHSMPDRGGLWPDGKPTPHHFHWHKGVLTDARGAKDQYAYLHFMFWRSGRYRLKRLGPPPWQNLETLVHVDWRSIGETGFDITRRGFLPPHSPQ